MQFKYLMLCNVINFFSGDILPGFLPKSTSLSVFKSKALRAKQLNEDVVRAVLILSTIDPYKSDIFEVSAKPFYVVYVTSSQIRLYASCSRKIPIIRLKFDATGGICPKVAFNLTHYHSYIFSSSHVSIIRAIPKLAAKRLNIC
jgi:hypothetical protein